MTLNSLLDEALECQNQEQYAAAHEIMKMAVKFFPGSAAANGVMGQICYFQESWIEASIYFGKATKINPKSELSSLGYFYSLWHLDKKEEAIAEMERYLKDYESEEYQRIRRGE